MFDLKKFERTAFEPRQREIALPALADFFKEGEPVFTVRGLTASDLGLAEESAKRGKLIGEMVEKLLESSGGKDKAAALLDAAGFTIKGEVPLAIKLRIEQVRLGMVSPAMDLVHVVKLADAFPMEFAKLANAVLELTGQGQVARVKQKPSGKNPT